MAVININSENTYRILIVGPKNSFHSNDEITSIIIKDLLIPVKLILYNTEYDHRFKDDYDKINSIIFLNDVDDYKSLDKLSLWIKESMTSHDNIYKLIVEIYKGDTYYNTSSDALKFADDNKLIYEGTIKKNDNVKINDLLKEIALDLSSNNYIIDNDTTSSCWMC